MLTFVLHIKADHSPCFHLVSSYLMSSILSSPVLSSPFFSIITTSTISIKFILKAFSANNNSFTMILLTFGYIMHHDKPELHPPPPFILFSLSPPVLSPSVVLPAVLSPPVLSPALLSIILSSPPRQFQQNLFKKHPLQITTALP